MRLALTIASAVASLTLVQACAPSRPAHVPREATPVNFGRGGWVHCWVDRTIELNRCRIFNGRGDRIYPFGHEGAEDDVFLKYEGDGAVAKSELQIDTIHTTPHVVWLTNGVVLIPRVDYKFGGTQMQCDNLAGPKPRAQSLKSTGVSVTA